MCILGVAASSLRAHCAAVAGARRAEPCGACGAVVDPDWGPWSESSGQQPLGFGARCRSVQATEALRSIEMQLTYADAGIRGALDPDREVRS